MHFIFAANITLPKSFKWSDRYNILPSQWPHRTIHRQILIDTRPYIHFDLITRSFGIQRLSYSHGIISVTEICLGAALLKLKPLHNELTALSPICHYDDVIMSAIAAHITSLTIVYSTVYPGADQSKHQSSASLAFVCGIHRGPVNSPHKWPVTRKMFPFDDVIMSVFTNRELLAKPTFNLWHEW